MANGTECAPPVRHMRITAKDGPDSVAGTHLDTPFILCGDRDDLIAFACRILRFFGTEVDEAAAVGEPSMGRAEIAIGFNWCPDAVPEPAPAPAPKSKSEQEIEAERIAGSGHDFGAPDDPEAVCGRCGVSYQHYADGIMRTCFGSVPRRGTVILAGASGGDWIADGNGGLLPTDQELTISIGELYILPP